MLGTKKPTVSLPREEEHSMEWTRKDPCHAWADPSPSRLLTFETGG
jgi:hypothetical protein